MNQNYTIESLLRPPIEWYSGGIMLATSALVWLTPATFLLTVPLSIMVVVVLSLLGVIRLYQGCRVIRYQRNLRRLRHWAVSSNEVPLSHKQLFLGRGFRWTAKHTQRLTDLNIPRHEKYKLPSQFYQIARRCEIRWENNTFLRFLARITSSDSWWNPVRPYPNVGGQPALHGVSLKEKNLHLQLSERVGHTLVLGTTRVGKTRFEELLVGQDIKRGEVVIVFDPKGDSDLLKRIVIEAKLAGREQDVKIFHLGFPKVSCRYNPIANFVRVTEVGNRISNQLPSSGDSAAFKAFGWRFINIITQALVALGRRPDYKQIAKHLLNIDDLFLEYCEYQLPQLDSNWRSKVKEIQSTLVLAKMPLNQQSKSVELIALVKYIERSEYRDNVAQGLASTFNYDRTYFDKITASLLPLLEKLTTGQCVELLSPNYDDIHDQRDILDWFQVIRNKQIVYIGLDALTDTTVASAVGNSMFADLVSVAGRLYNHGTGHGFYEVADRPVKTLSPINIHADEFNELIGDEFIPLVNKAGGSGIRVTAYSQTLSDIEARLGNQAKAGQVIGNFNNLVMFRVKESRTVDLLIKQLPQVKVHSLMAVSSVSDNPNAEDGKLFSSSNEDRIITNDVPMLSQNDISTLPKGQAFCLINGGQLYKLRVPLPKSEKMTLPSGIKRLCEYMRGHYQILD